MLFKSSNSGEVMTRMIYLAIVLIITTPLLEQNSVSADVLVGSWAADSIRRYSDDGDYLGDFVPTGVGGLDLPDGMDFGPDGNLYVASSNSNQVLRYNGQNGQFMDAFVDEGLSSPGNLQFGPDGFLYVCNKDTGEVFRFDPKDGSMESVFASGGGLTTPVGLLWKDDLLYVSDFAGVVRTYDAKTGVYAGDFANVPGPLILNLDSNGNILVSSHPLSNILRFDCDGNALGSFLNGGSVLCPVGFLDCGEGEMLVASWSNHRLLKYNLNDGEFLFEFSSGEGLFQPNDLLLMPEILLGDINQDGNIDLLDVTPFVDLLINGEFQAEADINGDGEVSLLDVEGFVDLLTN